MTQAATDLAGGDLDARANVERGPPEVRELAGRFNSMADRLGELIVSQRRFVADASHQLRSPLTALRLELEQADASDPDAVQRALHETRRLGRLVDGLLVLARSEGVRLDPTTVDVSRLVEDRVAFWAPVAAEGGVTLTADTRPGVLASAVEGHVDQVLDNLVANALEATDPGGRIRVRTRGPDPVVIEVDDDGPGMSEEARAHAFDRFWRGHGASPGTGSGLGLPIARQLARGSGGELTLGATETGGLRAVVRLPAARQGRR